MAQEGCLEEVQLHLEVREQEGPWEQKKAPQEGREWRHRRQTVEQTSQQGGVEEREEEIMEYGVWSGASSKWGASSCLWRVCGSCL